jgi:hypothetical protein
MSGSAFPDVPTVRSDLRSHVRGEALLHELLCGSLSETETTWRVMPIRRSTVRECESLLRKATFREFNEWVKGEITGDSNRLSDLPSYVSGEVAVYADYKHFNELFNLSEQSERINFENGTITLNEREQSHEVVSFRRIINPFYTDSSMPAVDMIPTLWLGSRGSHSPLHYDTYGRNVIAQMSGSKRWLIWSPNEFNAHPLPTLRVPYEESSVYSCFDPMVYIDSDGSLNAEINQQYPGCMSITLNAGDVLYMPPHYWHFVVTVC